mmetsp:Transcript_714/g.1681  ORF Transcript_714/g.1681 Transcript_714/m.1681 type:complete len:354 (+) Transcript_714:488-1549(+)
MVRRRGRRGGVRRALRRRRLRVRVSRHAGAAHGGVRPALPEGPHVRTPLLGRVAGARAEPGRPRQVGHVRVVGVRGEVRGPPLHLPPVRHDGGHVRLHRQSHTGRRLVVRVRRVLRPVPRRRPAPRASRAREDLRGVALRRVVPAVARRPEGGGRPPELRHVREPRDHRARVRVRPGPPPRPDLRADLPGRRTPAGPVEGRGGPDVQRLGGPVVVRRRARLRGPVRRDQRGVRVRRGARASGVLRSRPARRTHVLLRRLDEVPVQPVVRPRRPVRPAVPLEPRGQACHRRGVQRGSLGGGRRVVPEAAGGRGRGRGRRGRGRGRDGPGGDRLHRRLPVRQVRHEDGRRAPRGD